MQTEPSLLDWLRAKVSAPGIQRYFRFGLAGLTALVGAYMLLGRGQAIGYLFLGLGMGLFFWGFSLRGEATTSISSLPELNLTRPFTPSAVPSIVPTPSRAEATRQAWLGLMRWVGGSGAVLLALAGQYSLARFHARPWPGVLMLFGGAALWALVVRREALDGWWPTRAPTLEAQPILQAGTRVRWRLAGVALVLSALTFFVSANNNFPPLGRAAWVASLMVWALALWDGPIQFNWDWRGALERLWRGEVNIRLSRTLFLLIGVMVVAATIRFANLEAVPSEMTSDHIEKLIDVDDILNNGKRPIFEPDNSGREVMGFYIYAIVARAAGLGLTFINLKLTNALIGFLTLPLIFLAAREITDDDLTGLLAALTAGMAWWPNSISRNGLRFPLAPLFATLALWLVIRALKRRSRNAALLAGLAMGIGLYGYTAIRIVPVAGALAFGLYAWHSWSRTVTTNVARWLIVLGVLLLAGFVPLFRYSMDDPVAFWFRSLTRITGDPGENRPPTTQVFIQNEWNSLRMFNWTADAAWLVSPPGQPALDWVMGALLVMGWAVVVYRAINWRAWLDGLMALATLKWPKGERSIFLRSWLDLYLVVVIPILLLPSTLALAFPNENPSLHRSGSAIPIVFTLIALALRLLIEFGRRRLAGRLGTVVGVGLATVLLYTSYQANWKILFVDYARNFALSAQNASEIGRVIESFAHSIGSYDTAYVRPYPYWVDTRAVGIYANNFSHDYAIPKEQLADPLGDPRPKLFVLNLYDQETIAELRRLYPTGTLSRYTSAVPNHDFLLYFVPSALDVDESSLPIQ